MRLTSCSPASARQMPTLHPTELRMSEYHDPQAIARHAAEVGDWRLVELIGRRLSRGMYRKQPAAHRAYATLAVRLGLIDDRRDAR